MFKGKAELVDPEKNTPIATFTETCQSDGTAKMKVVLKAPITISGTERLAMLPRRQVRYHSDQKSRWSSRNAPCRGRKGDDPRGTVLVEEGRLFRQTILHPHRPRRAGGFAKDTTPFSKVSVGGFFPPQDQKEGGRSRFFRRDGAGAAPGEKRRGGISAGLVRPQGRRVIARNVCRPGSRCRAATYSEAYRHSVHTTPNVSLPAPLGHTSARRRRH